MKILAVTINLDKSHCVILATEAEGEVPELYHQRKGEIARCWIKYCLTLMQNAQLSMQVTQPKVAFSFLNEQDVSRSLKMEIMLIGFFMFIMPGMWNALPFSTF